MKKLFVNTLLAGAIALSASAASAQATILTENFDSYTDQAAFAAAWAYGNAQGLEFQTDGGHSGSNYVRHPLTLQRQGILFPAPVTPTDAAPMVVDFWIRVPTTQAGRVTVGVGSLTASAVTPVAEMGVYNAQVGNGWHFRLNLGAPVPSGWTHVGGTRVANTWTNLKYVIKTRDIDFYENGVHLGSAARTASDFPELNGIYVGAGVSSVMHVDVDSIVVSTTSNVSDWSMY